MRRRGEPMRRGRVSSCSIKRWMSEEVFRGECCWVERGVMLALGCYYGPALT